MSADATYGRIVFARNDKRLLKGQKFNLGDMFQTFAIDELLKQCGVIPAEVINVERRELTTFCSDKGIVNLPLCGMFYRVKGNEIFPMSPDIKPIFLGYCTNDASQIKMLARQASALPIGCRDEMTYQGLQKAGVSAFISGCMTLTLPRRTETPKKRKVFFVDTPRSLEPYVPQELRPDIEYLGQEIEMDLNLDKELLAKKNEALSRQRLTRFKEEATLVVTSRLHCAAPCTAMGIPVILVREYFDPRYTFLDRFIHLYTPDEFDKIDWNAAPVEMETEKALITQMAIAMLRGKPDTELNQRVHELYLGRERAEIRQPLKTKLYFFALAHAPKTADLLREHVLKHFSVATGSSRTEDNAPQSWQGCRKDNAQHE